MAETNFMANARAGWGEALPDWIVELAAQCDASTASAVAQRVGYSVSAISSAIRGTYKGDLGKIEQKVRGALMGEIVQCPVLDEITKDRCLAEQGKKHLGSSSTRAKLYRACRTCPNAYSRKETADAA
ncbi:MAG: transcriptional regulator [Rhodoblastus sp.]|nr:transcriptional regulator [Rhodoblastus sp.]